MAVKDKLDHMYVIGRGNRHQKFVRDPEGRQTKEGYPVYFARVPGSNGPCAVTEAFVSGRRVKLEYETAAQCTVTLPKRCTCLTHNVDHNNLDLWTTSVKARGLVVFKSVRSPCTS
ncbi:hypothetical protein CHARACLAT_019170, partial [Characodon lateralis]|nr:hypothetical protein [Characodon lateralis]